MRGMPRRPSPEETRRVLFEVAGGRRRVVRTPVLVAALRRETGCSRATGYRAVQDAIRAGMISHAPGARERRETAAREEA
jgi:hypothetical protein